MASDIKLWIGGSSGLARTYFNAFSSDHWILLGREERAPDWLLSADRESAGTNSIRQSNHHHSGKHDYVSCDLSTLAVSTQRQSRTDRLAQTVQKLERAMRTIRPSRRNNSTTISHIVVGIRPPLVTYRNHYFAAQYGQDLMTGYSLLLHALTSKFHVQTVLHVSSIAAVDHIPRQHLRSVRERDPSYVSLRHPYDRFKRGCEELTQLVCNTNNNNNNNEKKTKGKPMIRFTSVRLGAIFCDTPQCIQCNALALQCYTGPYLTTPIDCNSGRNVASLIHLMLHSPKPLLPVYNYTRCVSSYPNPVPYGEYLLAYRKAYNLDGIPMLLPAFVVKWCVVQPLHWLTVLLTTMVLYLVPAMVPPYLESMDYLLQVTLNEHSFDMRETIRDFPMILDAEENMETCFRRRQRALAAAAGPRGWRGGSKVNGAAPRGGRS